MPRTLAPWEMKHELLVRAEDETDPRFGCSPEQRSAEDLMRCGVVNLDKQSGPSSHEVAAWVKRVLKQNHVGHGGTLEAVA